MLHADNARKIRIRAPGTRGNGVPFQGKIELLPLSRLLRFEGGKYWVCCFAWLACVQGRGPCCKVCPTNPRHQQTKSGYFMRGPESWGERRREVREIERGPIDKSPSDKVTSHPSHSPLPIVLNPAATASDSDGEAVSHLVEPIFLEGVSRSRWGCRGGRRDGDWSFVYPYPIWKSLSIYPRGSCRGIISSHHRCSCESGERFSFP